ncbi:hypothetical protein BH11PLA2_BH11PLA2_36040 [soil metagenome]
MRTLMVLLMLSPLLTAAPVPKALAPDPLGKGYMGIRPTTSDSVTISTVEKDTPADVAGLKTGDEFVQIGPIKKPKTFDEVRDWVMTQRPGTNITVVVKRGTEEVSTQIILGVRPASLDRTGGVLVLEP